MADTARRKRSEAGSRRRHLQVRRAATLANRGQRQFESAHQLKKQKSHPFAGAIFAFEQMGNSVKILMFHHCEEITKTHIFHLSSHSLADSISD